MLPVMPNIALTNIFDIQKLFSSSMQRLRIEGYKVSVNESLYPSDAAVHPYVFLPKLAMRAEELSILVFGCRLFPGVLYAAKKGSACGMEMITAENSSYGENKNALTTLSHPGPNFETLTMGLRDLIIDLALTECFDIDMSNKLMLHKTMNMMIHKTFKETPEYQDGQIIPLLGADYLSINELHGMVYQSEPLKAINKAREVAEQLARERRKEFTDLDGIDQGH